MSESAVQIVKDVTSSTGGAVASAPVRVAMQKVSFQSMAPDALVTIQISNDGTTWATATNEENSDLGTTLQSTIDNVKERSEWIRFLVATDSGGPLLYRVIFNILKVN